MVSRGKTYRYQKFLCTTGSQICRAGFGTHSSAPPGIAFALEHPRLAFALQLQHAAVSTVGFSRSSAGLPCSTTQTAFEHHNLVGIVNRAHAMCDNEDRLALKQFRKSSLHVCLVFHVK